MRYSSFLTWIATGLAIGFAASQLGAQPVPPLIGQTLPITGNNLFVTHAPGDFSRIFAVSQQGVIRIVRLPQFTLDATPFLSVPGVAFGGEAGLLCIAFHPDYATNGYVYACFNRSGTTATPVVVRYSRDAGNPDLADVASAHEIITLGGGNTNHNGGWMGFGPDGLLYISTGDHGSSQNARDLTENLRGKIIRIDVDGDDFPADATRNYRIPPGNPFVGIEGDDEIYAFGFRNPWRCYIDAPTGNMYIGDVGSSREELNILPIAEPGLDFGWPCQEGAVNNCPAGTNIVLPIAHYRGKPTPPLFITGNAVIGGEVYHGCAIPPMEGRYLFGDLSGDIVSFRYDGTSVLDVINHTAAINFSAYGFGHDAYGELYIARPGAIARVASAVAIGRDCNANGIPDRCDLFAGTLTDANGDNVPDGCPFGDLDDDGSIGLSDLALLLSSFGSCAGAASYLSAADFDGNACNDLQDLALLMSRFGTIP